MKFSLPSIVNRSQTPLQKTFKDLRPVSIKSFSSISNKRKVSASPMRLSPMRNDSNDSVLNIRTVSDETHSVKSVQDPAYRRISSLLSELDSSRPRRPLKRTQATEKAQKLFAVAEALISIAGNNSEKASALSTAQLFISLGYTSDYETLVSMFKQIFECQTFNTISFTRSDVVKICEEPRIESLLRALLLEARENYGRDKTEGFDCLVTIIKTWWDKLDVAKNGFVPIEDICRFFIETQAIDNSVDGKKMFSRLTQFITYRQFFGIFSKSLFKYLISNLQEVASQHEFKCLPADFSISALRRKKLLDSMLGDSKIVITLHECSTYND